MAPRKGRIFNLSSFGGIPGVDLGPLYAASKFALESFSERLSNEITPLGLYVTVVDPGRFRSDVLGFESLRFGEKVEPDHDRWRARIQACLHEQRNGRQPAIARKVAVATVRLASEGTAPTRIFAGFGGDVGFEPRDPALDERADEGEYR